MTFHLWSKEQEDPWKGGPGQVKVETKDLTLSTSSKKAQNTTEERATGNVMDRDPDRSQIM